MSGTREGAAKAVKTNVALRGKDFYRKIGSIGGKNGSTGGFYNNPALARVAGAKGGRASRRKPNPFLEENHDKIKILYEQGFISIKEIANIMGVKYSVMRYYIDKRIKNA